MPAPRTKTNPRDYTGRQKQLLAEKAAAEREKRQDEITMIDSQVRAAKNVPIELDSSGREMPRAAEITEQEPVPVQVAPEFATIRVNCDLEKVTIGQDNHFDFAEGQVYRVPYHVALHLESLGYIWQWL
ncbi:hypothetical protein [Streptomyces sp. CBMA29]|uniref:hypothetical protein n=1 Tax=Streptomyces sp. CBMA29 TaxID=1896314 RepID=UPI001661EB9D|nr:hypothetical protein [Streptomyces sp. CBMA29]MBD0734055.1 hypothetical protein [Streptomyces sp. CBMA29]